MDQSLIGIMEIVGPAILLIVFGAIWFYDRSKGGFKPVKLV